VKKGELAAVTYDGSVIWTYGPEEGLCPPVVSRDTVYVGPSENRDGLLIAFDNETAKKLWKRPVSRMQSIAIAGSTLYYSEHGTISALRA
jgi:outer membrane protein assembly factor BamB